MKRRLRALGERWPWLGRALDVQERVGEIQGGMVASAVTLTIFLSLFPLLIVAIAVVGFVAAGDASVSSRIIDHLGLTGSGADTMRTAIRHAADSRAGASIVGIAGLLWSGSGAAVALQEAIRAPWQERSNGIRDRLRGTAWLVVAGLGFSVALALGGVLNFLPDQVPKLLVGIAAIAVGAALEVGLFLFLFWALGTHRVPWRDLVPGAVVAGIGFEVLKLVGTVYVPRLVARSSSLYGSIGVVFAILAWLTVLARLVVYASTVNAVRYERRAGTVVVPLRVPLLEGAQPVAATRGGIALDEPDPDPIGAATPDRPEAPVTGDADRHR